MWCRCEASNSNGQRGAHRDVPGTPAVGGGVHTRVGLGISDRILEYLLRFRKIIKVFENVSSTFETKCLLPFRRRTQNAFYPYYTVCIIQNKYTRKYTQHKYCY